MKQTPNRKLVKITKEQYNRIFASKLLTEGEMDSMAPTETDGDLKNETLELIKYLYRESKDLSPFWEQNGLSYEELCNYLSNKKLIVQKDGKYEIPKALGSPQRAVEEIETALQQAIGGPEEEMSTDIEMAPMMEPEVSDVEIEEDNYPLGAQDDPMAPWNQGEMEPEYTEEPIVELNGPLSTLASNHELSILTDGINQYVFVYGDISEQPLDDQQVNQWAQMNPQEIGYGLDSWVEGRDRLIQIDDALKQDLITMYDKDGSILNAINPIDEEEDFVGPVEPLTPIVIDSPSTGGNKVIEKLKELKREEEAMEGMAPEGLEEMTSAGSSATGGSSGPFTAPLNFGNGKEDDIIKKEIPTIYEMTDSSSSGQYDANALHGIGRDGSFKKTKKTKAETHTQWPDGGFVEFNDCTKLNNKVAGTGCSGGAVDNVVSVKKTSGNINAPSLNEMRILVTIAQKTGKTIKEIKTIIEAKKAKA